MVVPDTLEDARFVHNPLCAAGPKLRFYAGAVIRTDDGFALGALCVLDYRPRGIEPAQLQALRTLARQVMTLLTLRRQTREAQQLARMRGEISVALASVDSLRAILGRCAQTLVTLLDGAFARVWTLDEAAKTLVLQASAGMYTHLDGPHGRVKVGDFKIGRIARDRQPLLTNDVRHDPNIGDPAWAAREGMVAFGGHPLLVENRVVGVLGDLLAARRFRRRARRPGARRRRPRAVHRAQGRRGGVAAARADGPVPFPGSADMAQVLDHQSTLQKIASASVPPLRLCTVDLQDADGRLRRLAVSHVDPVKEGLLHTLRKRFPPSLDDPSWRRRGAAHRRAGARRGRAGCAASKAWRATPSICASCAHWRRAPCFACR